MFGLGLIVVAAAGGALLVVGIGLVLLGAESQKDSLVKIGTGIVIIGAVGLVFAGEEQEGGSSGSPPTEAEVRAKRCEAWRNEEFVPRRFERRAPRLCADPNAR